MNMTWRIIFCFLILAGGMAIWKFMGADTAITAQNEIREKGYYYSGEVWMTPEDYQSLKQSLALRDYSLQTSSDLVILPDVRDGKLSIEYSFFSVENYEGLDRTREFPSKFKFGFNTIPILAPILFFIVLFVFAMSPFMREQ